MKATRFSTKLRINEAKRIFPICFFFTFLSLSHRSKGFVRYREIVWVGGNSYEWSGDRTFDIRRKINIYRAMAAHVESQWVGQNNSGKLLESFPGKSVSAGSQGHCRLSLSAGAVLVRDIHTFIHSSLCVRIFQSYIHTPQRIPRI